MSRFARLLGRALAAWVGCLAAVCAAAPMPGTQWFNANQPGVPMDNVLAAGNHAYDAWGSWWDDGSGYQFRGTQIPAGQDHANGPAGHGYVRPGSALKYTYSASFLTRAPFSAVGTVDAAFKLWTDTVNGTQGVRGDDALLGFDWRRARPDEAFQIEISWRQQAVEGECRKAAACVFGYPSANAFTVPRLNLVFNEEYWSDGAGKWVKSNFDLDTSQEPANPGPAAAWDHPYDLFSTALHELGHLAGLDDLYNLYEDYAGYHPKAFPESIMGTSCAFGKDGFGSCLHDPMGFANDLNPYRRLIDSGSLQGVLDLYSIAIAEPGSLGLALVAALAAALLQRPRRRGAG